MTLTNLGGSGFLNGEWATVVSETGNPRTRRRTRSATRERRPFEQVMAYYWVTQSGSICRASASGGGCPSTATAARRIDQYGADNSFDEPPGAGGSLREGAVWTMRRTAKSSPTGHAIHFSQGFAFASTETGSARLRRLLGRRSATSFAVDHVTPSGAARVCADWARYNIRHGSTACGGSTPTCATRGSQRRGASRRPDLVWALFDIRNNLGRRADTMSSRVVGSSGRRCRGSCG